jgi:hypothetical protein
MYTHHMQLLKALDEGMVHALVEGGQLIKCMCACGAYTYMRLN